MVKLVMSKMSFLLALIALSGCASPSKTLPCGSTDWYEIGRQHGARGTASVAKDDPINQSCKIKEQKLDAQAAYESGLSLGLTEYCTEANGFLLGKANIKYQGSCPQVLEDAFLRGYKKGQKAVELTNEKQSLKSKIQSVEMNLQKAQSLALRGLLKGERIELQSEDKKIDGEITTLTKSVQPDTVLE